MDLTDPTSDIGLLSQWSVNRVTWPNGGRADGLCVFFHQIFIFFWVTRCLKSLSHSSVR